MTHKCSPRKLEYICKKEIADLGPILTLFLKKCKIVQTEGPLTHENFSENIY